MSSWLLPDYIFPTYRDVTVDFLKEIGIKALLIDIDNTLAPYEMPEPDDNIKNWFKVLAENGIKNAVSGGREREFVKIFKEKSFCRLEYFNPGSKLSFRIEWNDTSAGRIVSINGTPARFIPWGNRQEILYYEFR
jgi:hypothetical protein